jgi:hypothetical protein
MDGFKSSVQWTKRLFLGGKVLVTPLAEEADVADADEQLVLLLSKYPELISRSARKDDTLSCDYDSDAVWPSPRRLSKSVYAA